MPRPKKTPLVTEAENAIDVVETSEVIEDLNTIIIDDELFNFESDEPAPLYRGHAMHVEYGGLE